MTYEPLDVTTQGPVTYEAIHLPAVTTRAGDEHDYYNVTSSSKINSNDSPYEQLNVDVQRTPVYDQLTTTTTTT